MLTIDFVEIKLWTETPEPSTILNSKDLSILLISLSTNLAHFLKEYEFVKTLKIASVT